MRNLLYKTKNARPPRPRPHKAAQQGADLRPDTKNGESPTCNAGALPKGRPPARAKSHELPPYLPAAARRARMRSRSVSGSSGRTVPAADGADTAAGAATPAPGNAAQRRMVETSLP